MPENPNRKRAYAQRRSDTRQTRDSSVKASNRFNLPLLFALVLVIAFSIYSGLLKIPDFSKLNQTPSSVQSIDEANLASTYGLQFLEYVHPTHGFKIRYPVGYTVVSSETDLEALKFFSYAPNGNVGTIRVIVTSPPFLKADYSTMVSLLSESSIQSAVSRFGTSNFTLGGKQVFLINYTETVDVMDEAYLTSHYVFNCPNYGIIIESTMPESVSSENTVVSSMVESFVC